MAFIYPLAKSCFLAYLLAPGSLAINSANSGFLLTRRAVPYAAPPNPAIANQDSICCSLASFRRLLYASSEVV